MSFDLNEKVIVLTGGLGLLGKGFTRALTAAGAKVAIFDVSAAPDTDTVMALQVDVTKRDSIERGLEAVTKRWGTPYGLVNNAAIDAPPNASASENGPFEDFPSASWDRVMEVNVKGVMQCCQVVGGAMAKAGRGAIVNISSIYGMVGPDQRIYEYRRKGGDDFYKPVAYSASKSALFNLTRYLATYWGPKVRVNTLTFGGVFNGQDANFLEGYTRRVPLGRMAKVGEYDGPLVFLLSDAASYMTGSNLVVDGGWTAW